MRADAAATTSNHRKSSTSLSLRPFPIIPRPRAFSFFPSFSSPLEPRVLAPFFLSPFLLATRDRLLSQLVSFLETRASKEEHDRYVHCHRSVGFFYLYLSTSIKQPRRLWEHAGVVSVTQDHICAGFFFFIVADQGLFTNAPRQFPASDRNHRGQRSPCCRLKTVSGTRRRLN